MATSDTKDVKMAINGQVFFLIKEQAKSIVAIQALQTRMAVLESFQERLMQAIDNVNLHLASSKGAKDTSETPTAPTKTSPDAITVSEKKLRFAETVSDSRPETDGVKQDLSKSDSLNKDSGICASESSLPTDVSNLPTEEEDELLNLLEMIDQKSMELLQRVEGVGVPINDKTATSEMSETTSELLDNLLIEKVHTERQLSEVKAERDELRHKLTKLEMATEAVNKQKVKVQQELDATLADNQSLQDRIRKSNEYIRQTESMGCLWDIELASIKRKYLYFSEKSRSKISFILKENNVLELKKQLLGYVMENDILRAKLGKDEPSRVSAWLKIESQLRKKLKEAMEEKDRMQELLSTRDLEIASLKDKLREIEDDFGGDDDSCVKNFGMGSNEDWRPYDGQNVYNKRSNLNNASQFSPLGYGDFSKTQSLPAMQMSDAQAKLKEQESIRANYDHVYDTASFTEISLNHSYHSGHSVANSSPFNVNSKDLVDLSSPTEPNFSSTSTLVQSNYLYRPPLHSGLSAPNLSGMCNNHEALENWAFAPRKTGTVIKNDVGNNIGGAKLVNGHLCWKGTDNDRHSISSRQLSGSEDISSICTEFDPLSDDTPSCENFVDSLNLSIPLKPTQVAISQLSSIGDSLHSNSLDLGLTSSPVLYQDMRKVHIARSVDGIRELFVENGFSKRPHSSQYGHSSVAPILGRNGRHIHKVTNYGQEYSDCSLL